MTEHIVAVFPDAGMADAAERELQQSGIRAEAIRRYSGRGSQITPAAGDARTESGQPSGFWAWLLGEEGSGTTARPDQRVDADMFDRRASAGDAVLSVTLTDDTQIHRTIEVLEAHHPIGIDETTEEYEPATAPATGSTAATTGTAAMPAAGTGQTESESGRWTAAGTDAGQTQAQGREQEQVIPLAKEEVEIGKRQVDRGTTRVRRYVVESPVEREVSLHGERVTVERRRPTTGAGAAAGEFEERVVEVHETEEVPVVEKTARVEEEVVVRREPTERTERVHETVRREEVEITPDKTGRGSAQ